MELWDLYDAGGNKTGETWERSRAKEIPEGRFHIVCDVMVRRRGGDFLLTLRDPDKDLYPGCWEAGAGGSALAGETPEEAARRELWEETGLTADSLELIGVTLRPESRSFLYAWLAVVSSAGDSVRLQPGETSGYRWMTPLNFLGCLREGPVPQKQYPRYKPYLDRPGTLYSVRRLTEGDAEAVSDLIVATIRISNIGDYPAEMMEELIKTQTPADVLRKASWTHFYVAAEAGTGAVVGCGAIGPYWGKTDESSLFSIFVRPDHQGKGIGRAIVETLEKDEFALRARRIEVPASITGLNFYRRMGYDFRNGKETLDEERLYRLEKFTQIGDPRHD